MTCLSAHWVGERMKSTLCHPCRDSTKQDALQKSCKGMNMAICTRHPRKSIAASLDVVFLAAAYTLLEVDLGWALLLRDG
jgi:hypothetical protein